MLLRKRAFGKNQNFAFIRAFCGLFFPLPSFLHLILEEFDYLIFCAFFQRYKSIFLLMLSSGYSILIPRFPCSLFFLNY